LIQYNNKALYIVYIYTELRSYNHQNYIHPYTYAQRNGLKMLRNHKLRQNNFLSHRLLKWSRTALRFLGLLAIICIGIEIDPVIEWLLGMQ